MVKDYRHGRLTSPYSQLCESVFDVHQFLLFFLLHVSVFPPRVCDYFGPSRDGHTIINPHDDVSVAAADDCEENE